ncbi:ABC transporter ATP-binding protein [Paenibacillus melissococcoides]|uniref:ABC transporter ATP-binding protein n=1 Tax=Paenibacillus melissococcoides TaxID=2912268 RepID=A0ABM9FWF8_9BACL|nr:hypothetical protein J6TS7_54130 [Paenibacillus dendritiformis]CAH8243189.1 ABC transporter ATP-binding protein [Paenibacillus melissococcoides]CAH8703927.1 ABC transporter ATP-binding protein [Paenibacillus melissococcoides]CAH8707047.1 ABC transporter ATP-binding protein [Paenibacillus melissococcoides]
MRQRLGIAQALIHKPSVLILDEPFNGLDPEGVKSVRTLFQELAAKEGVAILLASHLMSEIELFCNRAIIMKKGEIIDDFSLRDVGQMPSKTSFYVDDIFHALSLLHSTGHDVQLDPLNNKLTISIKRDSVPEFLAYLLNNQIKVFEVRQEKNTLEERFMNVVGGNTIE